jgi:ABC-type spermidine/putrescine transport system permease subunit II
MDALETMPVSPHPRLIRRLYRSWAVIVFAFLYLPIAVLVIFSFEASSTIGLPWTGFSFRWYAGLGQNEALMSAVANSLIVATAVAVIGTAIGTMAAFALVRGGLRFPNAARVLITMPIMLPGILLGVAALVFLTQTFHVRLSLVTVVLGHLVFTTPFVVLIVVARLEGFDRRLEMAAADLGASPRQRVRLIVLPLIASSIIAAGLITVTLSIDEFIVTFFLVGSQLTLPMYIYTQIKFGVTPEVNAVATLLLVATFATLLLAGAAVKLAGLLRRRQSEPSGSKE